MTERVLGREGEQRLEAALREADRFFMGESRVHAAATALAARLDAEGIPYVMAGALALTVYGHVRMTEDVDVLLTREGLERFKARYLGLGSLERFPGSKGENDVKIDILVAGEFPGDGKPKPVRFPDPAAVAVRGQRFSVLPLDRLVELKLASGMTRPDRLKDLADVIALVRAQRLGVDFAERLDPYVRPKFLELWQSAQAPEDE